MRTQSEIQEEIDHVQEKLAHLMAELADVRSNQRRSKSNSYHKRKELLEKTAPIFEDMVEIGDLIEVTGSRAGKFRQVVKITKGRKHSGRWYCGTVHGHSVYDRRVKTDTGYKTEMIVDITKITDHGTNKIVAIQKNGEWIKAKDLIT